MRTFVALNIQDNNTGYMTSIVLVTYHPSILTFYELYALYPRPEIGRGFTA